MLVTPRNAVFAAVVALGLAASGLSADDGVIEINQTRAEAGGVTPSDVPGFPVLITQPGSYRLTSNLDYSGVPNAADRNGVEIQTDGVVLDLNGFSITGPTTCSGEPAAPVSTCSPTGTGDAVHFVSGGDVVVRNGIVRGAGSAGILCDQGCVVEDVHVIENGLTGVQVLNGPGTVRNVTARRNGGTGIWNAGVVTGCVSHDNAGYGIFLNPTSVASGNVVNRNGGNGIRCFTGVLVDNVVRNNQGFGLELFAGCGFGRNVVSGNTSGELSGAGTQIDINVCGSVPCP